MTNNEIIEKLQKQHIKDMSDAFQNGKDTKRAWDLKAAAEIKVAIQEEKIEKLQKRVIYLENIEADFKTLSKLTVAELFLRAYEAPREGP